MSSFRASHLWPGVPLALFSAALFGASTPFAKLLLGAVDPQLLAGAMYLGAGVGLATLHAGRAALAIEAPEAPLRGGDLPWLGAVVIFGGIAGPLLLMLGLARTSASSGSLLLNLEGLATMAIAWVVFRENVDRRLLAGAAAILAGAVVLSWQGKGVRLDMGGLLIAGACLAWGIDNNLTRKLSAADPLQIAMIKGLVAGAVNLGVALARGNEMPSAAIVAAAGGVGFLGVGVQPRPFRSRAATPRQRANRRLFLARAIHRRASRACPAAGTLHGTVAGRRSVDGRGPLSALGRETRART